MRLAVIPARGGSKRIPRKNIRLFAGRPMLHWSIAALQASGCVDRIVVSTDDAEIAAVARDGGAEVPFMRPAELADDHAGTLPVVRHAIDVLMPQAGADDWVCCAQATAPLMEGADIAHGLQVLQADRDARFVLAATAFGAPIQRAFMLDPAGRPQMFMPEHFTTRSQDLPTAYHDAGQFYWGRATDWMQARNLFTAESRAIVLPHWRVQDIDTPDDWTRAEALFRAGRAGPSATRLEDLAGQG